MKFEHSVTVRPAEVLDTLEQILKQKGYKPKVALTTNDLKRLATGRSIKFEVLLTINQNQDATLSLGYKDIFFQNDLFDALKGKCAQLSIFLKFISEKQIQEFTKEAFQALDPESKEFLNLFYQLRKPILERKKQKLTQVKLSNSEARMMSVSGKTHGEFGRRLLDLFLTRIEQLDIKKISKKELLESPIEKGFGFSVRTFNCLRAGRIATIRQLLQCDLQDLKRLRNFGEDGIKEIDNFRALFQLE